MASQHHTISLASDLTNFQRRFFSQLSVDQSMEDLVSQLEYLNKQTKDAASFGSLDPNTSALGWTVATNVKIVSGQAISLQQSNDDSLADLASWLDQTLRNESGCKKRSLDPLSYPSTPLRTSKRPRAPSFSTPSTPALSRPTSPTPSELPSSTTPPNTSTKERDHSFVRLWFLDHLSKPYPTLSQKESLATAAGITRNKVDSDLTNFRRRSGWTDLMNRFCGGDRDKMKRMVERVESGKEDREEVLKGVQGMKDYLGRKEEERVGDWVREVTALTSSLTSAPSVPTITSSTITKKQSTTSLSSLSTVSNALRTTARSSSGSSTISTTSSLSDASFYLPPKNNKRLNPNAEPFQPNKRYFPSHQNTNQDGEGEALWVDIYPHHQQQHQQSQAQQQFNSSIWSTSTSIPLLPHMSSSIGNTWSIPQNGGFQPSIQGWSEGSVSRISRAL